MKDGLRHLLQPLGEPRHLPQPKSKPPPRATAAFAFALAFDFAAGVAFDFTSALAPALAPAFLAFFFDLASFAAAAFATRAALIKPAAAEMPWEGAAPAAVSSGGGRASKGAAGGGGRASKGAAGGCEAGLAGTSHTESGLSSQSSWTGAVCNASIDGLGFFGVAGKTTSHGRPLPIIAWKNGIIAPIMFIIADGLDEEAEARLTGESLNDECDLLHAMAFLKVKSDFGSIFDLTSLSSSMYLPGHRCSKCSANVGNLSEVGNASAWRRPRAFLKAAFNSIMMSCALLTWTSPPTRATNKHVMLWEVFSDIDSKPMAKALATTTWTLSKWEAVVLDNLAQSDSVK